MDSEKYDAITFDVYGTLIDWEPTILATLGRWIKAKKAWELARRAGQRKARDNRA